jgi:hypothetical protein
VAGIDKMSNKVAKVAMRWWRMVLSFLNEGRDKAAADDK